MHEIVDAGTAPEKALGVFHDRRVLLVDLSALVLSNSGEKRDDAEIFVREWRAREALVLVGQVAKRDLLARVASMGMNALFEPYRTFGGVSVVPAPENKKRGLLILEGGIDGMLRRLEIGFHAVAYIVGSEQVDPYDRLIFNYHMNQVPLPCVKIPDSGPLPRRVKAPLD